MNLVIPEVREGETYVGILIKDGAFSHHVVLLPGEVESVTWELAGEWAESIGGKLPTRKEQALLFANTAEHFQPRFYWSDKQYSHNNVWLQYFLNGNQTIIDKGYEYRARAVRRVPIVYAGTKLEHTASQEHVGDWSQCQGRLARPNSDGWIEWNGGECPGADRHAS